MAVVEEKKLRLYADGQLKGEEDVAGAAAKKRRAFHRVGRGFAADAGLFSGKMLYFAVYTRALSPKTASHIHNSERLLLASVDATSSNTVFGLGLGGATSAAGACSFCPAGRASVVAGSVGANNCLLVAPGGYGDGENATEACPAGTAAGGPSRIRR